jgi:hypothetical protein
MIEILSIKLNAVSRCNSCVVGIRDFNSNFFSGKSGQA